MVPLIIIGATLVGALIGSGLTYWSMLIVGLRHARSQAKRAPVPAPMPPLPPFESKPIEIVCAKCRQPWSQEQIDGLLVGPSPETLAHAEELAAKVRAGAGVKQFDVGPEEYIMDDDGGLHEVLDLAQDVEPELPPLLQKVEAQLAEVFPDVDEELAEIPVVDGFMQTPEFKNVMRSVRQSAEAKGFVLCSACSLAGVVGDDHFCPPSQRTRKRAWAPDDRKVRAADYERPPL